MFVNYIVFYFIHAYLVLVEHNLLHKKVFTVYISSRCCLLENTWAHDWIYANYLSGSIKPNSILVKLVLGILHVFHVSHVNFVLNLARAYTFFSKGLYIFHEKNMLNLCFFFNGNEKNKKRKFLKPKIVFNFLLTRV